MRSSVVLLALSAFGAATASLGCKCTPNDGCWKKINWGALNSTVSGKLIRNTPPAISCYPGPEYDKEECAYVNSQWSNTTFQAEEPIGYSYPLDNNCPVVDRSAGQIPWPGRCGLGPSPVYTINATEPSELAAGIAFAQKNNVRLVVRNTGHDLLGKSLGYGSLQIWLRYIRKGITHQSRFKPSKACSKCDWTGAAFTVAGGYVWDEVYQEAFARDLIVVGGGDPTVGVIGGYIQGGGHSPATRDFGLASDQILEAQVVLADGSIVTANPCSHPDLFTAIRGGGGGTYGVVISVTIKAFPSKPVVAHSLLVVPKSILKLGPLQEAVTDIYASFPALSDAGFSGYGSWSISDPITKYGNSSAGYTHALAALDKPLSEAKAALEPLLKTLAKNTAVDVSVNWFEFPSYPAYYRAMSGVHQATGVPEFSLASRMFDKEALTSDRKALRKLIGKLAGNLLETTINQVLLVGGGKVLDEPDLSGANPAWRKTYLIHVVARGWLELFGPVIAKGIQDDITYNKYAAMRELTPSTGSYLNEADRNNPRWKEDFYGTANYDRLLKIKNKYDPDGVFYCPTCVGSPAWTQRNLAGENYGPLCAAK
ncbi:Putative Isoamyl alcohol oxidase (AFU_orthologue; AFUA_3G07410) [Aspergillus calidoustus]|uniref:Putative Isoamyl alcohol oxidase (AFU_orthologue AFUA_3G07410) n=1 Tax=Aspergillus calidoustus TaxID=454130 RepID=A0A0U5FZJ1_ASPCI|nr:Putative Isoamyl alcohol oxidase (AFU_orthologue; AFUA_3G07410) [Aspergillus calidoustus]